MTQTQALTQALVLSLTAPSDKQAESAADLAESFAAGLSMAQVEASKAAAVQIAETYLRVGR